MQDLQETDEDLEVLGALPETSPATDTYKLTPNSLVHFLGKRYRLVFILDYSPSTAVVVSFGAKFDSFLILKESVFDFRMRSKTAFCTIKFSCRFGIS